jgi:hypothetical protein
LKQREKNINKKKEIQIKLIKYDGKGYVTEIDGRYIIAGIFAYV